MSVSGGFVHRLRLKIAQNQGTEVDKISVARAAKEIKVPETTLRSTLEGRYPRSEAYWRKLRHYCQTSLDWLICGQIEKVDEAGLKSRQPRILAVEQDLDRLGLIRFALKDFQVEAARSSRNAAALICQNRYDLVLARAEMAWTAEELKILEFGLKPTRLIVLANAPLPFGHPLFRLAEQVLSGPLSRGRIAESVKRYFSLPATQPKNSF